MNKVEIDVLSKNNTHNKYIDVLSNYRGQQEQLQRRVEQLEGQVEQLHSEVGVWIGRSSCWNSCSKRAQQS